MPAERYSLPEIYNQAAQSHIRNPVVMIHGLGGSMLVDAQTDQIVWGAFSGTGSNPNSAAGIRQLALPMQKAAGEKFPPDDIADLQDSIHATGPLQKIRLDVLGMAFSVDVYRQILQTLGVGGFRDQVVRPGQIDYGSEHYTCFTFFYDWRKDIVENSRQLDKFLSETAEYVATEDKKRGIRRKELRFDVVAHSFGGLIARYYLRYGAADVCKSDDPPRVDWQGGRYISRLILVGAPNTGAAEALQSLLNGWQYSWLMPRFQPALIATFPSVYQIMPRPRHQIFTDASGSAVEVDLYDVDFWERNNQGIFSAGQEKYLRYLLPEAQVPRKTARSYVRAMLIRARRMHKALDVSPEKDCPAEIYLFTSNTVPTRNRVELIGAPGLYRAVFEDKDLYAPGDGTVTTANALADERQGRPWKPWVRTNISFTGIYMMEGDHLEITSSPRFTNNLLHILLAMPPAGTVPGANPESN
ncbi:MAG: hypothetical protein KGY56_06445 [Desulfobacterales bacterium]|nr:hypothetical protein [Desulfobacterales bacterium]